MGNLVALSHPTQKPTRNLSGNSICYIHLFDQKTHTINMSVSKIRTNFHANSEALINKQINTELNASYVYMSMAAYIDRDDVALAGFAKRFRENSEEEREHAQKLIDYQNRRGGRVVFQNIMKPPKEDWNTALEAVEASLKLEIEVYESLLNLHKVASEKEDT